MMACAFGEITLGIRLESILTPDSTIGMILSPPWKMPGSKVKLAKWWGYRASTLPTDGALERAVESGLGFLVFVGRDLALQPLTFQLEEFFLQGVQQDVRAACGSSCCQRGLRRAASHRPCCSAGKYQQQTADQPPAILMQRIWRPFGTAQPSAR